MHSSSNTTVRIMTRARCACATTCRPRSALDCHVQECMRGRRRACEGPQRFRRDVHGGVQRWESEAVATAALLCLERGRKNHRVRVRSSAGCVRGAEPSRTCLHGRGPAEGHRQGDREGPTHNAAAGMHRACRPQRVLGCTDIFTW